MTGWARRSRSADLDVMITVWPSTQAEGTKHEQPLICFCACWRRGIAPTGIPRMRDLENEVQEPPVLERLRVDPRGPNKSTGSPTGRGCQVRLLELQAANAAGRGMSPQSANGNAGAR